MSVRVEQENVIPRAKSSSPSNCMVVRGGTIPASIHSFPVMEHDISIYNEEETPTNGISQLIGNSDAFNDEREIEAAAAASQSLKTSPTTSSEPIETLPPAPPIIPPDVPPEVSTNQTLAPLHINVNECTKIETITRNNHDPELSRNGALGRKKMFQQPSLRMPLLANTSSAAPIIMGPPSNTSTEVLLSPAGNLHNGYQNLRRKSSGDGFPAGFLNRQNLKTNKQPHPLAVQRNVPSSSHRVIQNAGQISRPPSSLASPSGGGRKDHEMTRRRALVDRISKSRGTEYVHLLPQTEGLSHTQTSILLRKNRGVLSAEGLPYTMQGLIDCGAAPDRTKELFVEKLKEANKRRITHTDLDELTDVSDNEEDLNVDTEEKKSPKNLPRWIPKRIRYSGMLARTETLLEEKQALLGMLKTQNMVMNCSSGVRFVGEEMMPRRRRQLNGMYYLYDKSAFRRVSLNENECSRTLPIQSWTKRKIQNDVFGELANDKSSNPGPAVVKPPSTSEKWVNTGQSNTVTYLTNGEKREVTEYDYEEYRAGEGTQRVNELSSIDPVDFIVTAAFSPFEDRQMAYMYRLATAPSNSIRKKHGKSIYFEGDDRKAVDQSSISKKRSDKKKERKPMDDATSEEDDVRVKDSTRKRARGRPSTSRRKTSRMSVGAKFEAGIYYDYLFDDNSFEDISTKQLPQKANYANICVPPWSKISDDYWNDVPCSSNKSAEDLKVSVARQHYKLMHAERERNRIDYDRRSRNRAAATSSSNNAEDRYPPFDMLHFEPGAIQSRRLFASIERPYEQRDFLKNQEPKL